MKKEAKGVEGGGLAQRKEGVARLELRQPAPAPAKEAEAGDSPGQKAGLPVRCTQTSLPVRCTQTSLPVRCTQTSLPVRCTQTGEPVPARQTGSRWTAGRKLEIVLRLLRGEPLDSLSREQGVEISRLEEWRARGLAALECGLKERAQEPLAPVLTAAKQHIAELSMENELLRLRCERQEARFRSRRLGP